MFIQPTTVIRETKVLVLDENKLDFPPLVNLFLFGVLNSAEAMLLPILIYILSEN